MFAIDKHDARHFAISAVGAITLSTACIFAAVAPAKANAPVTVAAWQNQVADRVAQLPGNEIAPAKLARADVALHFTAAGNFASASLAHSSGVSAVDARAVTVANRLVYPQLPVTVRGTAQDVMLRLYFGDASQGAVVPSREMQAENASPAHGVKIAAR